MELPGKFPQDVFGVHVRHNNRMSSAIHGKQRNARQVALTFRIHSLAIFGSDEAHTLRNFANFEVRTVGARLSTTVNENAAVFKCLNSFASNRSANGTKTRTRTEWLDAHALLRCRTTSSSVYLVCAVQTASGLSSPSFSKETPSEAALGHCWH